MTDYIEREAALNFEAEITAAPSEIQAISQGMSLYAEHIKAIPAADVAPVRHGRWEYNPGDNIPYCSECMMPQDSECNYCPNCGADMREK